jgi:hypothetical protein
MSIIKRSVDGECLPISNRNSKLYLKSMKVNEYEVGIHKVSYEKVTTKSKFGQGSLAEGKGLVPLTSLTF